MKNINLHLTLILFSCISAGHINNPHCISGDCKNGVGKYRPAVNIFYEGEFKNGHWHGKGMKIVYSEPNLKCMYRGDFKFGYINGFGKYSCDFEYSKDLYSYHLEYEGEWVLDTWEGNGKVYNRLTGEEFTGYARNGVLCYFGNCYTGESKYINRNAIEYAGNMRFAEEHGYGKLIDRGNHRIYEGEFKNGVFHGKGKITYFYHNDWYEGDWVYGKEHGKGTIYYPSGKLDDLYKKTYKYYSYEGDFVRGHKNGYGVLKDKGGKIIVHVQFENDHLIAASDFIP